MRKKRIRTHLERVSERDQEGPRDQRTKGPKDQVEDDKQDQEYHKGSVEECTSSQECMEGGEQDDPETEFTLC